VTEVDRLDGSGRAEELARMIGGAAPTAAILASAREMLAARASRVRRSRA
jgi:DNA repair ATPase RecN